MEHQQQLQYEPDGSNTEPTNANYGGFSQQVSFWFTSGNWNSGIYNTRNSWGIQPEIRVSKLITLNMVMWTAKGEGVSQNVHVCPHGGGLDHCPHRLWFPHF